MKHYNPWQEAFDRVCKDVEKMGEEYRKQHPPVKVESLQDKFDRVCKGDATK